MVVEFIERDVHFEKIFLKLDSHLKEIVKTQIRKIMENPDVGKPMRFARKGTQEVYVGSFRLSYIYIAVDNRIVFLDLYHKNQQ